MRIVLDTNILIAAFISHGACADLFEHCIRYHEIVASEFIFTESSDNLTTKFKIPAREVNQAVQLLRSRIAVVVPLNLGTRVSRDPKDDPILGTVIQGDCQCIVTGDKDLLALKKYRGINIISPGDFWEYENKVLGKHTPSTRNPPSL